MTFSSDKNGFRESDNFDDGYENNGPSTSKNANVKPKLIPSSYLFRYSLPLYFRETIWKKGVNLESRYEIPQFHVLDQKPLPGKATPSLAKTAATTSTIAESADAQKSKKKVSAKSSANLSTTKTSAAAIQEQSQDQDAVDGVAVDQGPLNTRIAWSEDGLSLQFTVSGKKQKPYCRITDLEQSDSFEIFVDTRNTKTVHRATRFCHRFLFLPCGGGPNEKEPYGTMLKIRLARGEPTGIGQFQPQVTCQNKRGGYQLTCHLPKKFLEGWQPLEQPEIGIYYLFRDQELGVLPMVYDSALPVGEDPSLWPTAFLSKNQGK